MPTIEIVNYKPEHQPHFERLNRHWIEKYFEMEALDEDMLSDPERAILQPGGAILMALYDGEMAGTVALKKINSDTFEFTKMSVDERFRRKGIAEALSYASFDKARKLGASVVILYSNNILQPALRLYEKLGFQYIPDNNKEYKRAGIKMKIDL